MPLINLIYATVQICPRLPQPTQAEGITILPIVEHLISEAIFLILLIFIGYLVYYFTNRRNLLKFFGIGRWKKLVIYLANLRIIQGGAIDPNNNPRSYSGTAIAHGEMQASSRIKQGFSYLIPSLSESLGILRKIGISDVKIGIAPSPIVGMPIEHSCSIISLGSPAYNLVSGLIESTYNSRLRFNTAGKLITVVGQPPINDPLIGVLERIIDQPENRSFFYGAGLSEFATMRTGFFLIDEWRRLFDLYQADKNFIVIIRFDPNSLDSWTIIHQESY